MKLDEAANFLQWQKQQVKAAIEDGVMLPRSRKKAYLTALPIGTDYDIEETHLDGFIQQFEDEDNGRHPPVAVRRKLLIEARHRCAICKGTSALEYHHIIEFSELKHHDPTHMLLLCATCHTRCGKGEIDVVSQRKYKLGLTNDEEGDGYPARFSWDDLREVVLAVHTAVFASASTSIGKYDFTLISLEEKNRVNNLSPEYFAMMRDKHQPYLGRIKAFIGNPANTSLTEKYYEIIDELNSKTAADRDKFDHFEEMLIRIRDGAKSQLNGKTRTLNIFLTFMYFECDFGRKK